MNNFEYQRVTNLIFGKDQLSKLPHEIKKYTDKKILLTYGGGSIKKTGLYDQVINLLESNNIEYIELGGIKPNPEVDTARLGIKLIKENDIDFLLCVGGGSALDNTKHMAIGSVCEEDIWELVKDQSLIQDKTGLPKVGSIITLAATGSEMNVGGVISNPETEEKLGMFHPEVCPVFTFEDPNQLSTLPEYQKRAGVCDILSHLLEVYFSSHTDQLLSDRLIESIFKNVVSQYKEYIEDNTYNANGQIFLSSTLALNGITRLGRDGEDWMAHQLEHEVSAITDLTHGIGLAIIQPKLIREYYGMDIENNSDLIKFINFGKNVFGLTGPEVNIACECVKAIEHVFKDASGIEHLSDVDINNFDYTNAVSRAIESNSMGNYVTFTKEQLENLFKKF
ncbi:MAG: iron-containing alcohol dehydrogenase [Mycoplasmatales bacterium]